MVEAYYSAWKQALMSEMRGIKFEAEIDHNGFLKTTITSPALPEDVATLTMSIEVVNMGKDYIKVRLNASSGRSTWGRKLIREYKAEEYLPLDYSAPVDDPVRVDKTIVKEFSNIYDKLVEKAQEHIQAYPSFLEEAKSFLLSMKKHKAAATCELEASSERSVQTDTDGNPYGQFSITLDMRGVYISGSEVDFIEHFTDILKDVTKERTARTDMVYGWDVSWRGDTLRTPLYIKYKSDGPIMTVVSSEHQAGERVMSHTKQATVNLSTPTKYSHQLRINWASPLLGGNSPAWKIGFTYGIFHLTKMSFSGEGSVYLNGGRLWIRNVKFEKAETGLDFVLQNGLDHALEELGDKAVDAVKSIVVHDDVRDAVRLAYVNRVASTVRTPEWLEDTLDNLTRDFDATNDAKKPIYHALSNGNPVKTDLVKKLIEAIKFDIEGIEENGYGSQAEKNQMPTLKKILQWAEDAVRGNKLAARDTKQTVRDTIQRANKFLGYFIKPNIEKVQNDINSIIRRLDAARGQDYADVDLKEELRLNALKLKNYMSMMKDFKLPTGLPDPMELVYLTEERPGTHDYVKQNVKLFLNADLYVERTDEVEGLAQMMASACAYPLSKASAVEKLRTMCVDWVDWVKVHGREPNQNDAWWK